MPKHITEILQTTKKRFGGKAKMTIAERVFVHSDCFRRRMQKLAEETIPPKGGKK